jgi:methionyl-tRNA formyltransferase
MTPWISQLLAEWAIVGHRISWVHTPSEIPNGDLCFMLSCGEIVKPIILRRNSHNLVVHESKLPKGKGWSPLSWQVLEGAKEIPVTLFEAAENVDSGLIYLQNKIELSGDELVDELREKQATVTNDLCEKFIDRYPKILEDAQKQSGNPSFYPKRTAVDSMLNPQKSIAEQFNLLRIVDNQHYPAYFDWMGKRYLLRIEKEI